MIKLEPYYAWLKEQGACISYVGLRADEESRPGMIFPDTEGVQMRFPMREWGWTLEDVLAYNEKRGVEVPERTDCRWCFWQRLGEWYLLWRDDLGSYLEAEALEVFVSEERGAQHTWRSPSRDRWPASLAELRLTFEAGRVPTVSLKRMENDRMRLIGTCRVCTL